MILSRTLFREIFVSAVLGCVLLTAVLFLENSWRLFAFVVNNSGPFERVAYLFLLVLPQTLPFTVPLGVLVGTLISLSRKSADGEITAMRAAGIPGTRVAPAVLGFAFLGMCVAGTASLWLKPWSIEESARVTTELMAGQLNADIEPRVFEERFPGTILHVNNIAGGRWHQVFLADLTPSPDRGDTPVVTMATEAIAVPDLEQNRIQLTLKNQSRYEASAEVAEYRVYSTPESTEALQAKAPAPVRPSKPVTATETIPLYQAAYGEATGDPLEARIELHSRLALPAACLVLALAAIPLGISSRRRGKSPAAVLTVALAFVYYMGLITVTGMARQGTLPAGLAVWIPNILFAFAGLLLMGRLELLSGRDFLAGIMGIFRRKSAAAARTAAPAKSTRSTALLPQIVDGYLIGSFLYYFILSLATFVLMTHLYTFFELLSDIIRNNIPLSRVWTYLFYVTPRFVYEMTPVSVLTSVLVVFGVLSKNNELTAFKACGVSVYRLTAPILLTSLLLSGLLFAFDHYVVPQADRRQDAIRAEIKGRPAQTFLSPDRKWIYGVEDRIFYYRAYDPAQNIMADVNVFEIDPGTFQLRRHIRAQRARWEPALAAWVFQNGWSREMKGTQFGPLTDFTNATYVFTEIAETPDYFVKEAIQSQQMNYRELRDYIEELNQREFDTVKLRVQFYRKFSVPLFAFILAMVSAPFAFQTGARGAMAGVGISISIFIAYKAIGQLFEQLGNLNQLEPQWAAWSPDAVFLLAGTYFLARVRT